MTEKKESPKPKGRPSREPRRAISMTLTEPEIEQLREIGFGSASQGISIVLRDWNKAQDK